MKGGSATVRVAFVLRSAWPCLIAARIARKHITGVSSFTRDI